MARKAALGTVRSTLIGAVGSSLNLFATVESFCKRTYGGMHDEPLYPSQARRVVGLAFLASLAAWEEYVEAVFVRYLAGASAPSGYTPTPRGGTAVGIDHSYELITGSLGFDPDTSILSWSSPNRVIERSEIFFYQGQPFKGAIGKWNKQLQDASKIRNRVAHASSKCRSEFKSVALQHLGRDPKAKLSQGFSAGDLLLDTGQRGFPASNPAITYFEAYMNMFLDLADRLTPE